MMKFMWSIASKNLFRNKLRSSISILAIAISVAMVVMLRSLLTGMLDSMASLSIQYQTGHVKIVDTDYVKKERLLSLIHPVDGLEGEGAEALAARLEEVTGVERAVQRLKFGAAASNGDKLVGLMGWGVNPEDEVRYTDIEDEIVEGRMVQNGEPEVVLGAGILRDLNLQVGEKITFFFNTSWGSFKGSTFTIVGKVQSGLKMLDDHLLYLPLGEAQRILEMPDQATEMLLFAKDYKKLKPVVAEVRSIFAEADPDGRYRVMPWYKANSIMEMLLIAEDIYNVIYVLLILLASFVIINTMLMIVKERTQEIGMMTALGLQNRNILHLFIMEGTVMGIVGSFVGVVIGGVGSKFLEVVGLDYSEALSGINETLLMKPVIYGSFSFSNLVFCFVLGVIVTAIACIIPARRAAKLEPTEALRAI